MTEPTGKKSRVRRSPAERAKEMLATAVEAERKAREKRDQLTRDLGTAQRDYERASAFVNYARSHPDLPKAEPEGGDPTDQGVRDA